MSYQASLILDSLDHPTPRSAAESAYLDILLSLIYGPCKLEIKNSETGTVEIIELEADLENDESILRHMALTIVAAKFLTEEQKKELETWGLENLHGRHTSTSDWPGWEAIIGKKPKRFRHDAASE